MPIIASPLAYVLFSYVAVAVFAGTGALAAARKDHDVVTFTFFAAATGIGGGTIRDLFLDVPLFWIVDPTSLVICVVVGAGVWLLGHSRWDEPVLLWLDAVGMAAFAVLGAAKSATLGHSAPVNLVMGVLTASAGGIIRDVVAEEPSIMLRNLRHRRRRRRRGLPVACLLDQPDPRRRDWICLRLRLARRRSGVRLGAAAIPRRASQSVQALAAACSATAERSHFRNSGCDSSVSR